MQTGQVGWGGQAIPDSPNFRAPWFGRSRGKGAAGGRGARGARGKGQGASPQGLNQNGRRGPRRAGGRPSSVVPRTMLGSNYNGFSMAGEGMSVEQLVVLMQDLRPNQAIPDAVFHALFHFDSRATALLLKDLSKAGLDGRASELFEWLRALDAGHPLQVSYQHTLVSTLHPHPTS